MAKNKRLGKGMVKEEIDRVVNRGFTGRAAGPRAPRELKETAHREVAAAGVRYMNLTDPDDNVMDYHPSKREIALNRRKRKMRRR